MSFFSLFKRTPRKSHEERNQEAVRFLGQALHLAYLQGGIDSMRQANEKEAGTFEGYMSSIDQRNKKTVQIIYQIVGDIWGK